MAGVDLDSMRTIRQTSMREDNLVVEVGVIASWRLFKVANLFAVKEECHIRISIWARKRASQNAKYVNSRA